MLPDTHYEDFLKLISSHGGPGFEEAVGKMIEGLFGQYSNHVETDVMGNVIALIPGEGQATRRPRILLTAHMDEIALVVTKIEEGGFLRVAQSGGFDPRTLLGQEVVVHGQQALHGIIGSKPPHLTSPEERKKAAPLSDLYIDLALPEKRVRERVTIGDRVTLFREPMALLNDRVSGKVLDNRTSVAVLLECMKHLKTLHHEADCYAVATVQEEVGIRGARTVAYAINPDIGIGVDVTFAEMPGQDPDDSAIIGNGPAITFGPNIHPRVFRGLKQTAEKHGIPYQIELSQRPTGTDANPIQITRDGIAAGLVGIAIRYMHTSVETGSYPDIVEAGRLLAHYIASIGESEVEELSCY